MADRSVSVSLRARVSDFVAGMGAAKKSTQDLSRNMTETGASAERMRRKLEAATKALPKIEIDADSTPAEVKFAQLRAQMEKLSEKRIGIDIDAAAAMAEIQTIERELEQLQRDEASIDVKADIGTALAELRTVQGEVNRLDGQTANIRVDADVSGAMSGIAMVGAALASLAAAPALISIGAGALALGGAFTAAGVGAASFAAVAIPSLGRVNEALKQQEQAAGGAGGATKSAGQAAATAAQQALQLEQAERRVVDAKKAAKLAEEDLTRARQDAKRAIEDLNLSLKDGILSERDAALAVEEAQERLNEVMSDPEASDLQRRRAQLDYDQAVQRLEDQRVRTKRLQEDTAKANKAGVEGSEQVRSAKDKLAKANQAVIDAEKQLKVLILQQKAAMEQASGGAGGLISKFDKLSKSEKELAKDIKSFKDAYEDWQKSLQPDVFPAISGGLDLIKSQLPRISPLVKAAGKAFVDFEKDAKKSLKDPIFDKLLDDLEKQIPTAIKGLGNSFLNVAEGFAGILDAFLPFVPTVVGGLETITQKFADWGKSLKDSSEFKAFIAYVAENAPKAWQVLKNLAEAGGNIVKALLPAGSMSLDWLVTLSQKLASLSPDQIQAISGGVAAIFGAVKLGTTLKIGAFVLLAEVLGKMSPGEIQAVALAIGAVVLAVKGAQAVSGVLDFWSNLKGNISGVGDAASGTSGKLAAIGKAAGIAGGVLIAAEALDVLAKSASGADISVSGLTGAIHSFNKSGRITGDLAKAWGDDLKGSGPLVEGFGDSLRRAFDPGFLDSARTALLKTIEGTTVGLVKLDPAIDKLKQIDEALAQLVESGDTQGATELFNRLAKEATDAGVPIETLKKALPQYAQAVAAAQDPTKETAGAIGDATKKLDTFSSSLSAFSQRTDAAAALQGLKKSYDDVKDAVNKANGQLDLNKAKTNDQRDAIIAAREKFAGYIGDVKTAADKQADLARATGNTAGATDKAKEAILRQLKPLFDLAGNSKEAKDKIYDLAASYGIAKKDADKAASGVKGLNDAIKDLKSKTITITADVRQKVANKTEQQRNSADGNLFHYYARGGIQHFAGGSEKHIAEIAPAGAMRVWAEPETGGEAYVPLAPAKRARSTQILAAVADEFGMQLMPKKLALVAMANGGLVAGSTRVMSTGSGALTVSIDNLASLNAAVDSVGVTAEKVAKTTSSSSTSLNSAMTKLTAAITKLTAAITKAGTLATKTTSSGGGSSSSPSGGGSATKTTTKKTSSKKSSDALTAKKTTAPLKPKDQVDPYEGTGGNASVMEAAAYHGATEAVRQASALIGQTAGRAAGGMVTASASRALPINDPGIVGSGTSASRRSRPQLGGGTASGVYARPGTVEGSLLSLLLQRTAGGMKSGGDKPALHVEHYHEAPNSSVRRTAEELSYMGRRGG